MKNAITFMAIVCLLLSACSKNKGINTLPDIPNGQIIPLADPTNWAPSVIQSNKNAKQFNYGRFSVLKGLNVVLTVMAITDLGSNNIHVYLKSSGGKYLHLPGNSANSIAYTYYLKAANPNSGLYITRSTGVEETYEDVIVLAAKTSFLQSLTVPINFSDYGTAKTKLGF